MHTVFFWFYMIFKCSSIEKQIVSCGEHVVIYDVLKNHFHKPSEDIIGKTNAQKPCYNEHSHSFCPTVLSNLRPDKRIECEEQGCSEEASSCQSKQHMMDVTCSD